MTLESRIPDIAAGAGLGGLACAGAIYLGPALLGSGWTSIACGTLLGASALTLVARRYAEERSERVAKDSGKDLPVHGGLMPGGSAKPVEWLAAAIAAPPESREAAIRTKLSDCLTPLPRTPASGAQPFADYADEAVALLAFAICAHAIWTDGGKLARRILGELDALHRRPADPRREGLARLRASLHAHLEPDGKLLRHYANRREWHGTRETLMLDLLLYARKRRGVLASAEFLWLKGIDRGLWYALANAGRRTFLVEGLAAMDHYHHERIEGRPSREPRVGNAVTALMGIVDAAPKREPAAA